MGIARHTILCLVIGLGLMGADVFGVDRYVTPNGAGVQSGINWANAYSNLQQAVNDCGGVGDRIFFQYGTYARTSALTIQRKPGLSLLGGYQGVGGPGLVTNLPTVLVRSSGTIRLLDIAASTITVSRITVQGGSLVENGVGVRILTNSVVTITNCVIRNNSLVNSSGGYTYGAGLYQSGGQLTVLASRFETNTMDYISWDSHFWGGGVACVGGVQARFDGCTFVGNDLRMKHYECYGGALYVSGGSLTITNCSFIKNAARDGYSGSTAPDLLGGAVHVTGNVNPVLIDNCYFQGNHVGGSFANMRRGAAIYLDTPNRTVIRQSVFYANANALGGDGAIYLKRGRVAMTNVVVAQTVAANGLYVEAGTATVSHCTFADNALWGVRRLVGGECNGAEFHPVE